MATQATIVIWRDKHLGAAIAAAPFFWAVLWWWSSPTIDPAWPLREMQRFLLPALVYPVLEEIVFRGGLQTWLSREPRLAANWRGVSFANVATSFVFASLHLLVHAPAWAAAVFIPSLIFGYFRDRHQSLKTPVGLHVFYNAGYFLLFGA